MPDYTIVIEPDLFDPDSVNPEVYEDVIFRLGERRSETTVEISQNGSPSTTLFGTSSVFVGSSPVTKRVIEGASGTYDIEAPAEESSEVRGNAGGMVGAGKGTIKGTIKVGGGGVEKKAV